MPGGKRTDAISKRDLEVLEFIARFGVVPRSAVAMWAGTARTVTLTRERRLREAGLVEVHQPIWGESKLLVCTRVGLAAAGRGDLRPAKLSLATVRHMSQVAELGACLEAAGDRTLSEREILAEERVSGEHLYSPKLPNGRVHRADLLRTMGVGPPQAIEVELVAKGAARLDGILRAYRRAVARDQLSGVVYRCAPAIARVVRRAVERTSTDSVVEIEDLEVSGGWH